MTEVSRTEKAFRKGLRELRVREVQEVKAELYAVLGINNRTSFVAYADGRQSLPVEKYMGIERVFRAHGIEDCWGK